MPRSPQHWSGRLLRFVRICRGILEMPLDVIVVMDPIGSIKIAKDSTFAMLLEAQRRDHRLHYVIPGGLSLHGGEAVAQVAPLAVRDDPGAWFELGQPSRRTPGPGDVVLMRSDPPVDAGFIHDTLLLGFMQRQGAPVLNEPQSLRDFNKKLASPASTQCSPPTMTSRVASPHKTILGTPDAAALKTQRGIDGPPTLLRTPDTAKPN